MNPKLSTNQPLLRTAVDCALLRAYFSRVLASFCFPLSALASGILVLGGFLQACIYCALLLQRWAREILQVNAEHEAKKPNKKHQQTGKHQTKNNQTRKDTRQTTPEQKHQTRKNTKQTTPEHKTPDKNHQKRKTPNKKQQTRTNT